MSENLIVSIGEKAISSQDEMLILFDETATNDIQNVAIVHDNQQGKTPYQITVGDTLTIGNQVYTLTEIGERVNESLTMMGHATLLFKEREEEDLLPNAIYLTPARLPKLEVGMALIFN